MSKHAATHNAVNLSSGLSTDVSMTVVYVMVAAIVVALVVAYLRTPRDANGKRPAPFVGTFGLAPLYVGNRRRSRILDEANRRHFGN
jgi:hypothetical protein